MLHSNIKIGLEGLSNTIAGPDSEEAADKRAEYAGKGEDFSTPHYGKVASNARSDEEANVAEFLCSHTTSDAPKLDRQQEPGLLLSIRVNFLCASA